MKPMKILLVEDDERIAESLAEALTDENYVVDAATDGQEGWEYIQAFPYSLVILDVMLPKLDGVTLCQRVRRHSYSMPILMLTAKDTSTDQVIGLDAGADDYVVKPFDLKELMARIRALLRRGTTILPTVLEWEKLRLNPNTCEVRYAEQPLHLTPKEYRLLELFLRNSHRTFSRREILEHLWSFEEPPGEDTVKVHIRSLRQKLRLAGADADFIETVYGLGYRLKQNL
jgi:two-component system, OmpR family, response regulator